jgi:hypothetical protein
VTQRRARRESIPARARYGHVFIFRMNRGFHE